MPAQTGGAGTAPVTGTLIAAAATGAMPVSSPARPAPTLRTHVYQRRNATAVTATAR